MKLKKPVFLIAYPSDFEENHENLYINTEKEKVELFYTFTHLNGIELKNGWKDIITFCVSEKCPVIYFIDEKNRVWKYELTNQIFEKIEEIGGEGKETGKFKNVKDCTTSKNIFIAVDENRIQAFSTVNWQVLWEIKNGKDSSGNSFKPDTQNYQFNPVKIQADSSFLYVQEKYNSKSRILKFNLGGEFIETVLENGEILDLALFENEIKIIKDEGISNSLNLPKENITSADFDNYGHLYIGTKHYDDEQGSIFILDKNKNVVDNINLYKKKVKKLIIDKRNILYVLGETDKGNTLSVFYPEKIYIQNGELTYIFNSTIPNCQWHRLLLNADIPKGTTLTVLINADNKKEKAVSEIENTQWIFTNPTDLYIPENVHGKYLAVKIKFQSDSQKKTSPVLNSIKVYFPRITYTEYLPEFYKEDVGSKEILDRFLSIFQTVNEEIEKEILNTPLLIDPLAANPDFLSWLSRWLGLFRDENWEIEKWRTFLKDAFNFYKKRGTREGIISIIKLYLYNNYQISEKIKPPDFIQCNSENQKEENNEPIIIEPFQLKQCGAEIFEFNKDKKIDEFSFCVFLKPDQAKSEKDIEMIKKMINIWKPAYTEAKVVKMKNMILLGTMVNIGINSYLYEPEPSIGVAVMPFDTVLTDTENYPQIETHSRLGIDLNLKF